MNIPKSQLFFLCDHPKRIHPCIFFVLIFFLFTGFTGCEKLAGVLNSETVDIDDKQMVPFKSMYEVDRHALGFMPLPKEGKVWIERRYGADAKLAGYDVMLHIYNQTNMSRTIQFKKKDDSYQWTAEQEFYIGPRKIISVDGTFRESISITYEVGMKQPVIHYFGDDVRLQKSRLILNDIQPILKEWEVGQLKETVE